MSDQGYPPMDGGNPNPNPMAPTFQLATWLQRVGASFIDGVLWYAIIIVISFIGGRGGGALSLAFLASTAFSFWQLWNQGQTGQTIGKRVIRIKLVSETNAQLIGGGMSIVRGIAHIVDSIPCGVGYLFPLWDAKRQTLADKIMRTVVVNA